MEELTVKPTMENLYVVSELAQRILDSAGCPMKIQTRMNIVIDEIYGNIVKYSGAGSITIHAGMDENGMFVMRFIDNGKPYNPFEAPDPDIHTDFDSRPIGGLGVFIVKNSMDDVRYEYTDGQNQLTIKKKI